MSFLSGVGLDAELPRYARPNFPGLTRQKGAVMRFMASNRSGLLTLGVMFVVAALGFVATNAGDILSDTATTDAANPPLNVRETNLDANGHIKVHEQGTVAVTGTVNVGNNPATQDVRVTNTPLRVNTGGTVEKYFQEFSPFDENQHIEVNIGEFSKVRLAIVVNGKDDASAHVFYTTDANIYDSFDVDSSRTIFLGEAAGTKLVIELSDPDGEQVFVKVFGTY